MNDLIFEEINENNITLAIQTQMKAFSYNKWCCAFLDYIKLIINETEDKSFIIKNKENEIIGVIGYYVYPQYPDSIWLSWFGILPEYKRKGYGLKALEQIEEIIKNNKSNINFLRVYYTNTKEAEPLYKKFFTIKESYTNNEDKAITDDCKYYIYSKSLTTKVCEKWNNRFLDCDKDDKMSLKAIKILQSFYLLKQEKL